MNKFKIITSERGKNLVLLNNNKYSYVRTLKDGLMKWKCYNDSCSASLLTKIDKTFHSLNGEHVNHASNNNQKIERQILRENCKRKAEENISTRPLKVIKTELLNSDLPNIMNNDITSVRKAIYDKKRKQYPIYPTSLNEAISQLKNMQSNDLCLFKSNQFGFVPETNDFVCITSQKFKFYVETNRIFWRRYIRFCTKIFLTVKYITHICEWFLRTYCLFCFTEQKKQIYIEMWKYLLQIYPALNVKKLHFDLEIGAHEAVKEIFPNVIIETCCFHIAQAW